MKTITALKEENYFLNTMSACYITINGITYPTVEHAYQAAKTRDLEDRELIRLLKTPGEAKQYGRKVKIHSSK